MSELIANLGLDWKLLLAQMFNFGILAFVLTKLVYKPLLKALKERQKLAKATVDNAEESRKALENIDAETKQIEGEARKKADEIIKKAEVQASERRETLIVKANEEAEKIVSQARAEAKAERALLFSEARRDMASLVIRAAEKVLEREVTKEDSKKLAQKAIEELT
ncbi:MAG: ATP synthase F0 subunit B [Candidatus Terrybacteria bacterium RIFCSPLOWO2_01_FULL_48_14]|nr:MAG: ATP synthase F0 subunit B [Candidatus Terrybacteria bacterium RIFCSPLOWO2_01_FULL_48_14]